MRIIALICLLFAAFSPDAFAWDRWHRNLHDRHEEIDWGGHRYHYDDGRFYTHNAFGFFLSAPPVGAVVASIPTGNSRIVIGGTTYYHYNDVYYKNCPEGYIIVSDPIQYSNEKNMPQRRSLSGKTVTINVPNANGSYTPVTLVRQGNGYVGPQGEFYPGNPSVEQLEALYGK